MGVGLLAIVELLFAGPGIDCPDLVGLVEAVEIFFGTGLEAVGPADCTTRTAPDETPGTVTLDDRTPTGAGGTITLLLAPTTDHGPLTAG